MTAEIWNNIFSTQSWGQYPPEDLIRFIAKKFYSVKDRAKIEILEIGCGTGANLWYLAKEGFTTYGIDHSSIAVNLAHARLNAEYPSWKGKLYTGDIINLPFAENSLDAVIDIEAVYCNPFEKSQLIYNEVARVLKPNGVLYSRTFASGCWGDQTGEKISYDSWNVNEGPAKNKGLTRFTQQADISRLLEKFKIEEIELLTRTVNQLKNEIREWCISAEKI